MYKGARLLQCLCAAFFAGGTMVDPLMARAEHSFPIEFRQDVEMDGPFSVVHVSSWEQFKRIKRGEDSLEETEDLTDKQHTEAPQESLPSQPASSPSAPAQSKTDVPGNMVQQAAPAVIPRSPKRASANPPQPRRPIPPKPDPTLITAPVEPTETGTWWAFYAGDMKIHANRFYDPHGIDFKWAYSRKNPLPKNPRIVVFMHGSGDAEGAMLVNGPSTRGDIEVRTQDAEGYNQDWREWWTFGSDGQPYPGRRIAAALRFVTDRYLIDVTERGIILEGVSMGGSGAVVQTMILPDPWRENIAYSSARAGVIMPRHVAEKAPGQYASLPPDNSQNKALWDSIDFSVQAATDPVVRGIHYRHSFSSDDPFSSGPAGNTQLEFVNLVERHKIGGAFAWVKGDHAKFGQGLAMPDIAVFESPAQDVTLDRAHPAITNSTGNYPLLPTDRTNGTKYPRGHYNMGIIWDHANIVDDPSQIIFPLQYKPHKGIGKGVPDQPKQITVSVTPRRPRNFILEDGETLKWSWGNGALTGLATVSGDTVTIDSVPLISGQPYKKLRIYR